MIEAILSLLFSKLGGILVAVIGAAGFLLNLKWQKHKRQQAEARADGLQTQVEIQEGRQEVQHEVHKVVEDTRKKVEAGDAPGLSDDFNKL
jgi:hypothetical protein